MEPKQRRSLGESFELATAATVRALGACHNVNGNVQVSFGEETSSRYGQHIQLAPPPESEHAAALAAYRGSADTYACLLRFHSPKIHQNYAPAGGDARALFDRLEQVRCEALGGQRWPGVAANLSVALNQNLSAQPPTDLTDALPLLIHAALSAIELPPSTRFSLARWHEAIAPEPLRQLVNAVADQASFAEHCAALVFELGLEATAESEPQQTVMLEQEATADVETSSAEHQQYASERESGQPWRPPRADKLTTDYRVFTTEFDEIVAAENLCSGRELTRLRRLLDEQLLLLQGQILVARLANRLQRRLLAQQTRAWRFEQDEGLLDARRLPRVIIDPLSPLAFKQETESEFRDTVVSLLLDNSRSMRGWPIASSAMSADILARTLERCGVKVEILGFTTRQWKTGHALEKWVASGKPSQPGRLNEVRHIIYKAADAPWRRARNNLGLMLRVDLLKQNVDGEALLWAHERLLARPEQRRILLVVSDGAPVDEITLSANSAEYLDNHLRQVINWIEQRSPVQLAAIGIGHDVTQYYRQAAMIASPDQFGAALLEQLDRLFATLHST